MQPTVETVNIRNEREVVLDVLVKLFKLGAVIVNHKILVIVSQQICQNIISILVRYMSRSLKNGVPYRHAVAKSLKSDFSKKS